LRNRGGESEWRLVVYFGAVYQRDTCVFWRRLFVAEAHVLVGVGGEAEQLGGREDLNPVDELSLGLDLGEDLVEKVGFFLEVKVQDGDD